MQNPEQLNQNIENQDIAPKPEEQIVVPKHLNVDHQAIAQKEQIGLQDAQKQLEKAFGQSDVEKEAKIRELDSGTANTQELRQLAQSGEFLEGRNVPAHFKDFLKFFASQLNEKITPLGFCTAYENSLAEFMKSNWERIHNDDLRLAGLEKEQDKAKAIKEGFLMDDQKEKELAVGVWKEHMAETAKEFFPGDFADNVSQILGVMGYEQSADTFQFRQ